MTSLQVLLRHMVEIVPILTVKEFETDSLELDLLLDIE